MEPKAIAGGAARAASVLAALVAAAVILDAAAVLWSCARLAAEARSEAARQDTGEQAFSWDMKSAGDVCFEIAVGISIPVPGPGGLSFETTSGDPYFFMNLKKRRIPAFLYDVLRIEIKSTSATEMQIFFWEEGSSTPVQSAPFGIAAGENLLSIDLSEAEFSRIPSGGKERWGGRTGAVSTLRIDPATSPGVGITLKGIRLQGGVIGARKRMLSWGVRGFISGGEEVRGIQDAIDRVSQAQGPAAARISIGGGFNAGSDRTLAGKLAAMAEERSIAIAARIEGPSPSGIDLEILKSLGPVLIWVEFDAFWTRPEQMVEAVGKARFWSRGAPVFPCAVEIADGMEFGEGIRAVKPLDRLFLSSSNDPADWAVFILLLAWSAASAWMGVKGVDGGGRAKAIAEVALFALPVIYLSVSGGNLHRNPASYGVLAAMVIPVASVLARNPTGALGLEKKGLIAGSILCIAFTICSAAAIIACAMASKSLRFDMLNASHAGFYSLKALAQQAVLCLFLAPACARAAGKEGDQAALAASFVFAAVHLPNFTLSVATLLIGFAWVSIYYRTRAIIPIALSHAVLGSMLGATVGDPLLLSSRVGESFFPR